MTPPKPKFSIHDTVVVFNRESPYETFDGTVWFVVRQVLSYHQEWQYALYSPNEPELAVEDERELRGFYGENWKWHYTNPSPFKTPQPKPSDAIPEFTIGQYVMFRKRADYPRKVLRIEWHSFRAKFVYEIETSADPPFSLYWFAQQLYLVDEHGEIL